MWEAIRKNRHRSWILISLMGVLLVILGTVIGMAFSPDPTVGGGIGALAAVGVWFVLFLVATLSGDSLLLASSKAHEIRKADAPRLWNIVEEMTIASGLGKIPRVFVIDNDAPNAFAVGRKSESAAVAVTSGLLKRLDRDELQGVVAHEIGHIKNLDIRFMTLASVMVGSITLLSDIFLRSLFYGSVGRRSGSSRGGGQGQVVMIVVALAVAILAPIFARLLYFACSRRREYLADASAARFTRYPNGLASALEKITVLATKVKNVNRALAPLYIVTPLKGLAASGMFSTHPPSEKRITILRSMGGRAGYVDYEAAYRKLTGSGSPLIGSRTLDSDTAVEAREARVEKETKTDAIERIREVTGLLDRAAEFIPIACACGVNIKIPPGLIRDAVPCPRCGRRHDVPHATGTPSREPAAGERGPHAPMRYERSGSGWESFRCRCSKVLQISPNFIAPTMTCRSCGQSIEIVSTDSQ